MIIAETAEDVALMILERDHELNCYGKCLCQKLKEIEEIGRAYEKLKREKEQMRQ